jgi:hypothetical protein
MMKQEKVSVGRAVAEYLAEVRAMHLSVVNQVAVNLAGVVG